MVAPLTTEQRAELEKLLPIVGKLAKRYRSDSDTEDFLQECALGMVSAIQRHDPEKGTAATLAYWAVKSAYTRTKRARYRWGVGRTVEGQSAVLVSTETVLGSDQTIGELLISDEMPPEMKTALRSELARVMGDFD